MRQVRIVFLVVVAVVLGHAALADCTGGAPTAWVDLYWDSGYEGDLLGYDAYYQDSQYKLAVIDVGDWWDGKISSFDCFDDYPAHWWMYDHPECGTLKQEGDGDVNFSGSNNDDAGSFKFQCPSDKDRTWFTFCEHHDCGGDAQQIKLYKEGNSYEVIWEVPNLDKRWNNDISSIRTGVNGTLPKANAYWYFYKGKHFNDGGDADLILKNEQSRSSLGDLNDEITSFRLVISNDSTAPTTVQATPAGQVPDGSTPPGQPLTVDLMGNGNITLAWGASCVPSDNDYAVYEGPMVGDFSSHDRVTCSTSGLTTYTFAPGMGDNHYYLVVPLSNVVPPTEGSYGTSGNDLERYPGLINCGEHSPRGCP